jgi:tripartite-type tricarboxylate transporter receptor subunit TctC
MKRKITLFFVVFFVIGLSFTWAAGQQDAAKKDGLNYPTRPIKFVVPWAPGGSSDAMARALSSVAKKHLGVELNVVNRDGAGGTIAVTELKGEKADGYTIMLNAVGTMTTQPV